MYLQAMKKWMIFGIKELLLHKIVVSRYKINYVYCLNQMLPLPYGENSGMLNKIKNTIISILASTAITGCGVSESIRYQHQPSEYFYKDLNIDNPKLKPFIDNNVLMVCYIQDSNHDIYDIGIGFYTEKRLKKIYIKRLYFIGNNLNYSIDVDKNFLINENVSNRKNNNILFKNLLLLENIDEKNLVKFFNENNQMRVEVVYTIEGKNKKMSFIIERKIEKRVIFPT